ncbi:MAG: hypothetical protein IKZ06_04015, partial [Oscillospiraceae bacterium]|nr:hypothetical protein [Oscillospiraceae bacterium]
LSMLKNELENIEENPDAQFLEDIGCGYVRLDLHFAKSAGISKEKICEIFVESANCGKKTELEPKLKLLEKLSKEGRTPFSESELLEYLSAYNGEMVSHSEQYKKEYLPAYRVVLKNLAENLQ